MSNPFNYAAISEGHCPHGHGRLTVVDDPHGPPYGWCDACGCGWAIHNSTLTLTLNARMPNSMVLADAAPPSRRDRS